MLLIASITYILLINYGDVFSLAFFCP